MLLACPAWQTVAFAQNGAAPTIAFDITKAEIPNQVAHGWSQITDHVTYLSVRPDPDRVLPAGYVYPLLLKNLPTAITAPPPARRPD